MYFAEAQLFEARLQPLAARSLSPGWRGDGGDFQLTVFQFAGVRAKPGEGFVHRAQLGQARNLFARRLSCDGAAAGKSFTKKRAG